ncbi:hypothetical protein BH11PLA2_BH11PLA2_07230 [soil metagenome]
MNEPLLQFLNDALGLMNPNFATPSKPITLAFEFYQQFRKLWDKGVSVGYGLGHLIIEPLDAVTLSIRRMDEPGKPGEDLALIHFTPPERIRPGYQVVLEVTPALTFERY